MLHSLHKLHKANRQGLENNAESHNESTPEVLKIVLLDKLDKGSANDGSGRIQQGGMIFGKKYRFKVTSFSNQNNKNHKINWIIKYHSLSKKKWIFLKGKSKSDTFSFEKLNLLNETNESIDMLDLCGRFIYIKAYINEESNVEYLKVWHHNRFRFLDRIKIENQLNDRQENPWKINQGSTSLCGTACIFYIMASEMPDEYYEFTKELLRKGESTFNSIIIKPHNKANEMYDISITDKDYPRNMAEADWLTLAIVRSSQNSTLGVYKGDTDDTTAISWPKMMVKLCKSFLGYKDVVANNINVPIKKYFLTNNSLHLNIGKLINQINNEIVNGNKIIMLIDSDLIANDEDNLSNLFQFEYHWVVLLSPIQSYTDFDTNNQIIKKLNFIVFTWGTNIYDVNRRYLRESISYEHFSKNFYGYIKVK